MVFSKISKVLAETSAEGSVVIEGSSSYFSSYS